LLPHQIQKCRKSGTHGLWLTWIDFMFSVLSGQLPTKHSCLIATTDLLCFIVGCKFWGRFRVFTAFFLLHILVGSLRNEKDMDSSVYALETAWTNLWAIWVFWKDFSDWYEVQDFPNSLQKHISLFKRDKFLPEEPPSELLMFMGETVFLQLMSLQDRLVTASLGSHLINLLGGGDNVMAWIVTSTISRCNSWISMSRSAGFWILNIHPLNSAILDVMN